MRVLNVSASFQARVDAVLTLIEQEQPSAGRLRRVPIDLIALAVAKELGPHLWTSGPDLWAENARIADALKNVMQRNSSIVRAPIGDEFQRVD